jgi:hypothetical protein
MSHQAARAHQQQAGTTELGTEIFNGGVTASPARPLPTGPLRCGQTVALRIPHDGGIPRCASSDHNRSGDFPSQRCSFFSVALIA